MKFFRTEVRENILIAYFSDPKHKNALGLDAAKELHEIQKHIEHKNIQGFVLTSDDSIFCSGGNLSDYAKLKHRTHGIKINRHIAKILADISEIAIPTVVLVRGDCFGGGIEWISCFDKIYSLPHVLFGMWQRKIGLSWGWGGGHRLKMRVSKKNLQNLLLSAENITAYGAQEIRLVDEICPEEYILEKALRWLQVQLELPKEPLKKIKKQNLKKEKKIFEELWMNPEHKQILKKYIKN
jgi:enoyl-CoA hydratase/carnithine racemase